MTYDAIASDTTVIAVAHILAKAALYDPRFSKPDEGKAIAWAEALQPHNFDTHDMLAAVVNYYSENLDRPLMVADVIGRTKAIRRDRAQREDAQSRDARAQAHDHRHGLRVVPGDPQLGGLPIAGADGPPIPGAYKVNDAVERTCPTCNAEPLEPCTNPRTGSARKIPCLKRMKPLKTGNTVA